MINNTSVTFSEIICFIEYFLIAKMYLLPAKKLPCQKAWYQCNIIEVSVGNKVSEHAEKIANLYWVDIGLVNMSMDEVRKAQKSIEKVTQRQVENESDGVELKLGELLSVFGPNVGKCNQSQ